jgi:hypothetical protein
MTLDEWIAKYVAKTGDYPYVREGFNVQFEPEYGFFYWRVDGEVFEIDHVCTDNRDIWDAWATWCAKYHKCKVFRTHVCRSPERAERIKNAYMKLMKCHEKPELHGYWPNGKWYWCFEREVK